MEMRKLLIADASEEFRTELAEILRGNYTVQLCREGGQTLELLLDMKPDFLVLDLMLPGLDGISLLQQAAEAGLEPVVLATTAFANDYVLETLSRMGVGYVMMKPCSVFAVAARLADLDQTLKPAAAARSDPRALVTKHLDTLGFSSKLGGYKCLREAVLEKIRDPAQLFTKEVYPNVARMIGGNGPRVERLIRTAIDTAWETRDEQVWRGYFRPRQSGHLKRPTNGTLISTLAERVALRLEAEGVR